MKAKCLMLLVHCKVSGFVDFSEVTREGCHSHGFNSIFPYSTYLLLVRAMPDKIYVMWTPPQNRNVTVRNYILGWGKGVPDEYFHSLDEKHRSFIIEHLEPQTEYVLSLRASNQVGAGPPVYANVRTYEDQPIETKPLLPPVGLKVRVFSPTSVILDWTDNTLNKNQDIRDSRYYVVKFREEKGKKDRYINSTSLSVLIDDLKPNTLYDFSVALVKGKCRR